MNLIQDASVWTLYGATGSGKNFYMTDNSACVLNVAEGDLGSFNGTLTFSCIVDPGAKYYLATATFNIYVTYDTNSTETHTVFLNNNKGSSCVVPIAISAGTIKSIRLEFQTSTACSVLSAALNAVATTDISAAVTELQTSLTTHLLKDYNKKILTIGNAETLVGIISTSVAKEVDLSGHFNCNIYTAATVSTQVTIRIYDNSIKCLYAPIVTTIPPGFSNIAIPHAYLTTLAGAHNFTLTMQATNDILITTRGILYTIEGQGLAVQIDNFCDELQDLCAVVEAGEITQLYTVSIYENVLTVRKSAYSSQQSALKWAFEYAIENVKLAAIEPNGEWRTGTGKPIFWTDATPQVFFTDMDDNLYVQNGNDPYSKLLLATDVAIDVAAVRGWIYDSAYTDNDTGLIVAYIKSDGLAYYKQYAEVGGQPVTWQPETQIPFTTVNLLASISVARTNDFRIVFTCTDTAGESYSLFSRRYLQADSVEACRLLATINTAVAFGKEVSLEEMPQIINVYNTTNYTVTIELNKPLYYSSLDSLKSLFTFKDANNVSYTVTGITADSEVNGGSNIFTLTVSGFVTYTAPMTITYTSGDAGFVYNEQMMPFTAIISSVSATLEVIYLHNDTAENVMANITPVLTLVPITTTQLFSAVPVSNVTAVVTPTLLITYITYHNVYEPAENILATITTSVTLTKVGTEPL